MKKLLSVFALLFTLNASAQIAPIDSAFFSINGNGVDTTFYVLIPHNSYYASHCAANLTTSSGWIIGNSVPAIISSYISPDVALISDTLYFNAYNVAWSNTGIPLYPLRHSRGGNIYTFKCYLY